MQKVCCLESLASRYMMAVSRFASRTVLAGVRTTKFDDEDSARQHDDREAARTRRYMAVVEDEGSFYVMTMRSADAYTRPHPETVFIVYRAEPVCDVDPH
jgi:hypothetical protein